MRAVVCKEFGPPEKLVVEELEAPQPGPGQVLIDVKAAAVTFPDCLMLENKYQFKAPLPFIPGGEVAGRVAALGNRFHIFLLSPSRQPATVVRLARRFGEGMFDGLDSPTLVEVTMGLMHLSETQAQRASRGDKPAKEIMRGVQDVLVTRKGGLLSRFVDQGSRVDLEQAVSVLARTRAMMEQLQGWGIPIEWHEFAKEHTIDQEGEIPLLRRWIGERLA